MVERLDLAVAHRALHLGERDRQDPHRRDDVLHVVRGVGRPVVIVDAPRDAVFLERAPEDELQRRRVTLEAEAAVQAEPAVVVQERVQVGLPHTSRLSGVREPRSIDHVRLPQLVREVRLEAVEILRGLRLGTSTGDPVREQGAVHGAAARLPLGEQLEVLGDADDAVERALRHFPLERAQRGDLGVVEHADAAGGPGGVRQRVDPALPVAPGPDADRLGGDAEQLPVRAHPRLRGQLFEDRPAMATGGEECDIRRDDLVTGKSPGIRQHNLQLSVGRLPAAVAPFDVTPGGTKTDRPPRRSPGASHPSLPMRVSESRGAQLPVQPRPNLSQ